MLGWEILCSKSLSDLGQLCLPVVSPLPSLQTEPGALALPAILGGAKEKCTEKLAGHSCVRAAV